MCVALLEGNASLEFFVAFLANLLNNYVGYLDSFQMKQLKC